MNSLRSFWQAATDFGQHITDVRFDALMIAVGFTLANLILRASAWRLILQAGYPERVRWRSIVGAYLAGAGVNSILPARGGDVMKIYLAHRSMPKAAYTTITSSLLAETLVDVFIGPVLLIAAYLTGRIPHLPALGHLAAFEWSFFAANARWFMLVMAILLILLGVFFTYVERHVVAFWSRVRLGLIILTTPRRYFRTVVPLQLAGWCCRIGAMYWFLVAFHVPAGVVDAALALSAQSASTLLPFTPGGLGTQQALLGYMFRNAAATSTVLAFSVGMQVMVTLTTAVAGGIAIWVTLRRLPWRARPPAGGRADGVAPG